MELFLAEMDEAGITQAIVRGSKRGPKFGGDVSNDELVELRELYPGRFHLLGGVSLGDIPAAVAEIERIATMDFKGITAYPGWSDPPARFDEQRFYPIYDKCQELGMILMVTFSIYMGPDLTYVEPVRLQHVASDFPDLLIVVTHGGWPYVMEFLGIAFRYPNVWLAPDLYINTPGIPGSQHYVEAANFYLADRLLFASSYPSRPMKRSVEDFKRLPLRPEVLEKALYKNAQWILGDRKD
jgi:predicted TIM-barrel fold metal-dependent hydrolase